MNDYYWKQQRLGRFTASRIYRLLQTGKSEDVPFGKDAMTYILETAVERLTGEPANDVHSKATEWGVLHEPAAFAAYVKRTRAKATCYGTENPLFYEYGDFAGGSPDGVTRTRLIEIKCPYKSANHIENRMLTPDDFAAQRPEYYAQIQFNMLLTKRSLAHFVSFDPRMASDKLQLFILEIERNDAFIDHLKSRIESAEKILIKILRQIITQ